MRIGDDDVSGFACYFGVSAQLAGTTAVYFIEDDLGGAAVKVRVADDDAAQLGVLRTLRGVVEDQPLSIDVVVLELVVRQAIGIRRSDIDDRHAIAGLSQPGARRTDRDAIGLSPERLPEHDVGQQESQRALGNATERLARLHGRRRQAGQ
ncbi:hypothetical protein D3C81_1474440 [compost metagenome]